MTFETEPTYYLSRTTVLAPPSPRDVYRAVFLNSVVTTVDDLEDPSPFEGGWSTEPYRAFEADWWLVAWLADRVVLTAPTCAVARWDPKDGVPETRGFCGPADVPHLGARRMKPIRDWMESRELGPTVCAAVQLGWAADDLVLGLRAGLTAADAWSIGRAGWTDEVRESARLLTQLSTR